MARAIDLDKAIEIIEEKQKELCPVGRYGRNYVYGSDREKWDAWDEIIYAIDALPTLTPPNEPEYREYTCPCCSHTWLEDRDALDYPEYCPGCGATLRDGSAPPNEPLTLEELREMGGQPYWHVGLREESPPPHWNILDPFCAKRIEDYKYGENWIAYRRPPEGEADA